MKVFALDTNFVVPRILHGGKRKETNLLDVLLWLQTTGKLKVSFHRATQAETYAILRAGRLAFRNQDGRKEKRKFSHHQIMQLAYNYRDLFDVNFLLSLEKIGLDDESKYKELLFTEVKYVIGMDIKQSREYIENKKIPLDNCKDPYDYHIMVTAIKDNADFLVTSNLQDFPNPLGNCQVISEKELQNVLPVYP